MIFGLFYVYTKGNYTTKADFKKETITPNGQRFIYQKIKLKAHILKEFCKTNGYNSQFGFIADFSIESNKYRFFVYNFKKDSIVAKGLVAHGSCNTAFLPNAKFKNEVGCGCSTKGKYKIGYSYVGKFGKAYKLHGLDTSNSLAFDRNIVLHAYSCVPNNESTELLCNSLGCPMLNYTFLNKLETYINALSKPIILWIVE
jgi:hypothetical protein